MGPDKQLEIQGVKIQCKDMLAKALSQLKLRLSESKQIFHNLAKLSPIVVLNQATRPKFNELPFLHTITDKLQRQTEDQCRKIPFVDWTAEAFLSSKGLNFDTEIFWIGVRENNSFVDLANYALTCLTTPVSSTTVKRIFSLVTNVKTKPRNRLQLHTPDAIVRIRSDMVLSNKCFKEFVVTQNMLRRWTSENMYRYESKTTPVPCTSLSSTSVTEETGKEDISMFI